MYVPRWQTEAVATAAASALPIGGIAIDLCCGSGAVARVLQHAVPEATVLAADVDRAAVACARRNGVDAVVGDLFDPLPGEARGRADVVVAVTPYVPTRALPTLARTHEPLGALHGGTDGLDVLRRVVVQSPEWLRAGGALVVELARPQLNTVAGMLRDRGFGAIGAVVDGDRDVAGAVARFGVSD